MTDGNTLFPPSPLIPAGTARFRRACASLPATPCISNASIRAARRCIPSMNLPQYLAIDRSRIHALTGPIFVDGAEPGDVLADRRARSRAQGLGLDERGRRPRFSEAAFFRALPLSSGNSTAMSAASLAPAVVPLRPFCGVMGVAPAEDGEFRTRPPGIFGGNMDVRELCTGATLYLPVLNPGALFSAGDAHAAQGDGEVCINGIECPVDVTLRFQLHKQRTLPGPLIESAPQRKQDNETGWIVVESDNERHRRRARRHLAHDRSARRPLGLQRRPRVSAVQRGAASEIQPGGQRADVHRKRHNPQARAPHQENVLSGAGTLAGAASASTKAAAPPTAENVPSSKVSLSKPEV